jgi:putative inorganic carbon (HCO3(-)) transporter
MTRPCPRTRRLRSALNWLADWQIAPVALLAPVFMLADRLPNEVVALAALAIVPLWWNYRVVRGRFFTPTPLDVPLLILIATLLLGVWVSALPVLALPFLLRYLFAVVLFYALVNSLTNRYRVESAGWAVLIGTAFLAGLGLVGTAWGGGNKFLPVDSYRLAQRIPHLIDAFWYSAGFHPNIVGGSLAVFVPLTAAYAWLAHTWPSRLFLWLLFLAEAVVLVLTQSRGGLLGFGVAMLVLAIGRGGRADRRWAWLVVAPLVFLAIGFVLYGIQTSALVSSALELVAGDIGEGVALSLDLRMELVSRGLYMLQDFPFTGVGLGMFPLVLSILYPLFPGGTNAAMTLEIPHVHTIYLQMGIDHGFPGLIAFLALVILLWGMGIRVLRLSRGRRWEPLALGLLAGLAAYLTHGLVDAIWHTPRSHPLIWGHWGLLTAVWCWARTRPTD